MHEMAIIPSILECVCAEAEAAGAHKVITINLAVGEIRDFHTHLVQNCFDWFARDTVADGAEINIRTIPLALACTECGRIMSPEKAEGEGGHRPVVVGDDTLVTPHGGTRWLAVHCPDHPEASVTIAGGNELYIDDIHVE